MIRNKLALYVHFVWAAWDRLPLITPEIERALQRQIQAEALQLECCVLAIGGVEDHVHALVQMTPQLAISELIKQLKGTSSQLVNETLCPDGFFKWQGGYAAFSVSRWDVPKIVHYIHNQREHHSLGTAKSQLEAPTSFLVADPSIGWFTDD